MSTNLNIQVMGNPVDMGGGAIWNRLHSERESICEALIQDSVSDTNALRNEDTANSVNWHRNLLQARLTKVDDALDRLMSGSYGNCCECGKWIEDTKLEFDPAIAFCLGCWGREQRRDSNTPQFNAKLETDRDSSLSTLALETLAAFDIVNVDTLNSTYRIFLLEPQTGRSLVYGGEYFAEPREALVTGSRSRDPRIKNTELCVGRRMEMWVNGKLVSTSPTQSILVEPYDPAEPHQYLCGR